MKEVVKPNEAKVNSRYYYPILGDYREFACGWGAQIINISLTYPVNKLIFRQMLLGINVRNAFLQMMDEGLTSLYRGILPPLMQKSVSSSLMFGTYDMFKKQLMQTNFHPKISSSVAAVLAGSVEAMLTPFERIQTLLQDSAYQKDFVNMKHVVKVIGLEYGFREYYRGVVPILCRNGPSNVLFFALREEFNEKTQANSVSSVWYLEIFKHFLIGACIGAVNSTIFHPFNVIKVHMQSQLGGSFQSLWKAARDIYIDRGRKISHFYKGVPMNCIRSFISWGVVNMAYEQLKIVIFLNDDDVIRS